MARGWYWPCSGKEGEYLKLVYMKGREAYSAVQLDEHHETTGNELRHRDQNRIERRRRLHGIGRGTI